MLSSRQKLVRQQALFNWKTWIWELLMFWHSSSISITLLAMNSLVILLKLEGKSYLVLIEVYLVVCPCLAPYCYITPWWTGSNCQLLKQSHVYLSKSYARITMWCKRHFSTCYLETTSTTIYMTKQRNWGLRHLDLKLTLISRSIFLSIDVCFTFRGTNSCDYVCMIHCLLED